MTTKSRQDKIKRVMKNRLPKVRLIIEDVHDPHNAAAILRTCDALGVGSVWYLFDQEEPYNPKKVGKASSSSANKWVEIEVFKDRAVLEDRLKEEEFVSLASTIHEPDAKSLWESNLKEGKVALWVGNEHRGLSAKAMAFCDRKITIPMLGFVESLNVSVAAALFLAEIVRQRRYQGE